MNLGKLERTSSPQPMGEINMTPLIDVMLVLVVILLVTAPLLASTLKLNLPKTDAAATSDTPKRIQVGIDKTGQLFADDKPTDLAALKAAFAERAKQSKDTEVQLRADEAVAYGKVVEVIGAAQLAGLNRIGFVAQPQGAAPKPAN